MSDNQEAVQQLIEGGESNESEEVYNQLGMAGIYDEMTLINFEESRRRGGAPNAEIREEQRMSAEVSETGARGRV